MSSTALFVAESSNPDEGGAEPVTTAGDPEARSTPRVRVASAGFDGPFDLLLHLILKDEVDLYEVSLSDIVDAYLDEVRRMQTTNLDLATEFLLIAATLIDLKVRRLLPEDADVDLDEEIALWEERDLLLSRLLESKTFKDAASAFERLMETAERVRPRVTGLEEHFLGLAPDLLEQSTPADVRRAFHRAMRPRPVTSVDLLHVTAVTASVTVAIQELLERLPGGGPATFRELTGHVVDDTLEIVVRFLAVLELFKQGLVEIDQVGRFGDLVVEWAGSDADQQLVLGGADVYDG